MPQLEECDGELISIYLINVLLNGGPQFLLKATVMLEVRNGSWLSAATHSAILCAGQATQHETTLVDGTLSLNVLCI